MTINVTLNFQLLLKTKKNDGKVKKDILKASQNTYDNKSDVPITWRKVNLA